MNEISAVYVTFNPQMLTHKVNLPVSYCDLFVVFACFVCLRVYRVDMQDGVERKQLITTSISHHMHNYIDARTPQILLNFYIKTHFLKRQIAQG